MNKDNLFFKTRDFEEYGPLAEPIIKELNATLTDSVKQAGGTLDDDPLPRATEIVKEDMVSEPYLYVSSEIMQEMADYAEANNLT